MSRLAGFYIAKAVEGAARSTTPAAASRVTPGRTSEHAALDTRRTQDRTPAVFQRAVAAVHHITGGLRSATERISDN
jgi:hypothetical protein